MRSLNPQLWDPLCQAPEDIEQLLLVEGDLSTKRWGQSLSGPIGGLQQFCQLGQIIHLGCLNCLDPSSSPSDSQSNFHR